MCLSDKIRKLLRLKENQSFEKQIPHIEDNEQQIKEQSTELEEQKSTEPGDIEWLDGFEDKSIIQEKVIIKKEVVIMENPDVQTLTKCWSCSKMYYTSNHHCPFCGAFYKRRMWLF